MATEKVYAYNIPNVTKSPLYTLITSHEPKKMLQTTSTLPYIKSKKENFDQSMTELERKIQGEWKITVPYSKNKSIVRLFMEAMRTDCKNELTFEEKKFPDVKEYALTLITTHQDFFKKLYAQEDRYAADCMPFLHAAATNGYNEICTTLLDYGAQPDDQTPKFFSTCTPLHLAAKNGHIKTVSLFLNKNASPNFKCHLGNTPLHDMIRKLENAMDDNDRNLSDIYKKIISLLIRNGADINIKNRSLYTPIQVLRDLQGHAKEITQYFQEEVKEAEDAKSKKRATDLMIKEAPSFFTEQEKKKQRTTGSFHGLTSAVTGKTHDLLCTPESVITPTTGREAKTGTISSTSMHFGY